MSRIGKLPVQIPSGVIITVGDSEITVQGAKGTLIVPKLPAVTTTVEEGVARVTRGNDEKISKSQHGLQRALIQNAVTGVVSGFEKKLEVNGVGFRVNGGGNQIDMTLGFSHPVVYKAGEGITLTVERNLIMVSGIDKQAVGQTAAEIRSLKKPEPYKGKGIKYVDEVLLRKAGKTGK
jgi:large subunit ribosomal protein L6